MYQLHKIVLNAIATLSEAIDMRKVANAIDSAKGRAQKDGSSKKDGKIRVQKHWVKFNTNTTETYVAKRTDEIGLLFGHFNEAIESLAKIHGNDWEPTIPPVYHTWLLGMKKEAPAPAPEKELSPVS